MTDTRIIEDGSFRIALEGDYVLRPSILVQIRRMVTLARANMNRVVGLTGQSETDAYKTCIGAYFRLPGGLRPAEYIGYAHRLNRNLVELNAGLQSRDLTLHTAIGQHAGMEDAAAYVRRDDYAGALRERLGFGNPNSRAGFYGDIFMNFGNLGTDERNAANLVHEASHRYLGARDWAYLPNFDMIDYLEHWSSIGIPAPLPPKSPNALTSWGAMTVEQALNNADSYGGFVSRFRIPL